MSERAGSSPGHVPEAAPTDFYETRYAPERQRLQDMIFREVYDDYFGQSSWITTASYDRFYRWLEVTAEARVLDVACGNGAPALRLAGALFGCTVVGINSNAHAITRASAVARERGLSERVRFEIHDAGQPLPFHDRAFDAVTCMDALGHLPDRPSVFAAWARVLKPGGRLLFTRSGGDRPGVEGRNDEARPKTHPSSLPVSVVFRTSRFSRGGPTDMSTSAPGAARRQGHSRRSSRNS
jgi:SAM-dependent methyltransferase